MKAIITLFLLVITFSAAQAQYWKPVVSIPTGSSLETNCDGFVETKEFRYVSFRSVIPRLGEGSKQIIRSKDNTEVTKVIVRTAPTFKKDTETIKTKEVVSSDGSIQHIRKRKEQVNRSSKVGINKSEPAQPKTYSP